MRSQISIGKTAHIVASRQSQPFTAAGLVRRGVLVALSFARRSLKSEAQALQALDEAGLSDIGLTHVPIKTTWTHCGSGMPLRPMVKYRYRPVAD